jgi:hypothetical protein
MSAPQTRGEGNGLEQLSSLASAVLILNLSEMTGVCYSFCLQLTLTYLGKESSNPMPDDLH